MKNELIYDKPFKNLDEMIELMEKRNIIISDKDFARRVLNGISYYTLINGYKNTFLSVKGTDNFVDGTEFNNLYTLHIIDTNINNIVLKYILYIERYLKTRLSYIISEKYGVFTDPHDLTNNNPNDYLCRNNYSRSANRRNNILLAIKKTLTYESINESVAHYLNEKNHIPAWILVTNITFGLSIKWYSILANTDKSSICSNFIPDQNLSDQDKKEFVSKALDLLRQYRNKIAHSNRTFCVSNLPVLPKRQLLHLSSNALAEEEYNNGSGKSDLYAVILSCFILLDDKYILTNFLQDLLYTLNPYEQVKMNGKTIFEIFNLPNNIFERLEQLMIDKFIPRKY